MSAFPSPLQTLLLRAATGPQPLEAWELWRDAVDFDRIDPESARLAPLLYRNLARHGVSEGATQRYASVYRRSLAGNRLAFMAAARALEHLHARGIPTLLLKGAALSLLHYRDLGVRWMADVDVLVPRERILDAVALLEPRGWRISSGPLDARRLSLEHSVGLGTASRTSIDLHWFATADSATPKVDAPFWDASVATSIEGVPTRALGPTDLLYNVLAHAFSSFASHARWAADAMVLLATAGDRIDWARLVRLAEDRRMVVPLRASLSWLRAELDAAVPEQALAAFAQARTHAVDRWEYAQRMSARPFTLDKVLVRHWCWHRRSSPARGVALALAFPDYLARRWGAASARDVPRLALERGLARLTGSPGARQKAPSGADDAP